MGLIILWLIMIGIFIILALDLKRNIKTGMEDWIKQNNLKHKKEISIGILSKEAVSFTNIIWGLYKNKRIYIYTLTDSNGIESDKKIFFNGNFYSKIRAENIDKLLENENYLNKREDVFGSCRNAEISQMLVADVFLKFNKEIDYWTARKIYLLLEKFADSKISFIDIFTRSFKLNIKFNDPEAINFVIKNYNKLWDVFTNPLRVKNYNKIEEDVIKQVADAYESLLLKYYKRKIKTEDPLKNVDMSKFR